jgi:glycerol-3-phosphate dehydrogenase
MLSRGEILEKLKTDIFDVIVIGGGATGAGIVLDSQLRGLKSLVIERGDFSSGTSSKSTKLVHGGVRYLEQAVKTLDRSQIALVMSALRERKNIFRIAPHLVRALPILTPCPSMASVPYLLAGLKIYDWLAGDSGLSQSSFLSVRKTRRASELLDVSRIYGSVKYYDGQFDDARLNVELVLTACDAGALAVNYMEVAELHKEKGCLTGARVLDRLSGEYYEIRGKVFVNATGPYVDAIRLLDDPDIAPVVRCSSGTHIVVRKQQEDNCPGILIPHTPDKRVIFILPWRDHLVIGTTDEPSFPHFNPTPLPGEIHYLLEQANRYLKVPLEHSDVQAAWCGLRPLVNHGAESSSTASLSRDHFLMTSPSGLITITGGKWTTYRLMAEEVVDRVISMGRFSDIGPCLTMQYGIRGAHGGLRVLPSQLEDEFGITASQANHLVSTYGNRAFDVLKGRSLKPLIDGWPYLEAEVDYCLQEEMVQVADDFVSRRIRVGFCDAHISGVVVDRIKDRVPLAEVGHPQILHEQPSETPPS